MNHDDWFIVNIVSNAGQLELVTLVHILTELVDNQQAVISKPLGCSYWKLTTGDTGDDHNNQLGLHDHGLVNGHGSKLQIRMAM